MSLPAPSYLILHSEHGGDLQKPWIVYRCYHANDEQDELFRGDRASAAAYLAEHWDDEPTNQMQVDRGLSRETAVMCDVDLSSGIAGQTACIECGGDGDWTKFHPEPHTLAEPLPCVECKGTGRVWVSA